ncbi:hypothetical protein [Blastococcus sp. SYSU DS0617]
MSTRGPKRRDPARAARPKDERSQQPDRTPPGGGAVVAVPPAALPKQNGRRLLLALLGAVLAVAALVAIDRLLPRTWTAEALVAVLPEDPAGDVSVQFTAIWVEIGDSAAIRQQAADALGIDTADLRDALTVSQSAGAPLVSVRVTTQDMQRSAEWANAVAAQLLEEAEDDPVPGYDLGQVTEALPPATADVRAGLALIGVVALGGALLGAGAGVLLDRRASRRATA